MLVWKPKEAKSICKVKIGIPSSNWNHIQFAKLNFVHFNLQTDIITPKLQTELAYPILQRVYVNQ